LHPGRAGALACLRPNGDPLSICLPCVTMRWSGSSAWRKTSAGWRRWGCSRCMARPCTSDATLARARVGGPCRRSHHLSHRVVVQHGSGRRLQSTFAAPDASALCAETALAMPLLTTCEPAQLSATMTRQQNAEQAAQRAVRRPASAPAARALVDAPQRRSSRIEGKPARNYSEGEQPGAERPERRSRLLDRHSARLATPTPPCVLLTTDAAALAPQRRGPVAS